MTEPSWRFREKVKAADDALFVTPESNRSVPGVLKNAIDVGSRPYGHRAWHGKPAAVVSVSPGEIGGFGANHHPRQSFVFLDVPSTQQPEANIGAAATSSTKKDISPTMAGEGSSKTSWKPSPR